MLERYYDWLSRFQRVTGWATRSGRTRLTVHRRLVPSGPGSHVDGVHEALLGALGDLPPRPRVLDAGCGLGGTTFFLHGRLGGQYDGLTLSRVQLHRAQREARHLGVQAECRFHLRDYDEDLRELAPEGVDLVVAVESLLHSPDLARTLSNFAASLRPGGRIAVVDDVPSPDMDGDDRDFAVLQRDWCAPAMRRHDQWLDAFRRAGLAIERDDDLTDRVRRRSPRTIERLERVNRRLHVLTGHSGAGVLLDGLHGGLVLERLYARGLMHYRLIVARR